MSYFRAAPVPPRGSVQSDATRYYENGIISRTDFSPRPLITVSKQRSSVKTPGFKTLKRHQLPINNYSASFQMTEIRPGTVKIAFPSNNLTGFTDVYTGDLDYWYGTYSALGRVQFPDINGAQEARNNCLSRISELKFNAAQSFAERKQTANLLISSVNRLVTTAVLIRKGKFAEANKILKKSVKLFEPKGSHSSNRARPPSVKDFPNIWLEYSYGWRPLVNDIYSSAKLLADTYYRNRDVVTATGSATRTDNLSILEKTYNGLPFALISGSIDHKAKCTVRYIVDSSVATTLANTGLSNPALLAWELLPYSFVVDWVLPVGNYLENVNASSGLSFLNGFIEQMTFIRGNVEIYRDNTYPNHSGGSGGCSNFQGAITRSRLTAFPTATFPSFSPNLNLSQVTSGLALLSQIFGKGTKVR